MDSENEKEDWITKISKNRFVSLFFVRDKGAKVFILTIKILNNFSISVMIH